MYKKKEDDIFSYFLILKYLLLFLECLILQVSHVSEITKDKLDLFITFLLTLILNRLVSRSIQLWYFGGSLDIISNVHSNLDLAQMVVYGLFGSCFVYTHTCLIDSRQSCLSHCF